MRQRVSLACLFTLLAIGLFGQAALMASRAESPASANPTQGSAEVAKIKAYHDQIDAYAKAHPTAVRYFSSGDEIGSDNQTIYHWKEYKNRKEMPVQETHASVWMKDGKVVAAILSTNTDHTHSSDGYYFRADGTLAYVESHGSSIGLDPPNMQSKAYYSSDGKTISKTILCSVDEKKWETCKADSGWVAPDADSDTKNYLKNTDLPFFNLLAKVN
jgi:hypothetical protein